VTHRYKLTVEYDGAPFFGWQSQRDGRAVEDYVRRAIQGFCGGVLDMAAAGRTDAGVHARGQVIHIDLDAEWEPARIRAGVNYHLKPHPISVLDVVPVSSTFHARFSATRRIYCYRILSRPAVPTIDRDYLWWVPQELQLDRMRDAAQVLMGHHDFTTFRSVQCQARSPIKTLTLLDIEEVGQGRFDVHAEAPSFLHRQVRSLVGALKVAGTGQWSVDDVAKALSARDRSACPPVAPAQGLYFMQVDYDEK